VVGVDLGVEEVVGMKLYRFDGVDDYGGDVWVEVVAVPIDWCAEHDRPYTGCCTDACASWWGDCRLEDPPQHYRIKPPTEKETP
jgi:hypothetical protein